MTERPKPDHYMLAWSACFWALKARWSSAATVEVSTLNHGIADVMALGHPDKPPKLVIIEVKVSRSDLLADLRARKMLKYEGIASHCYLCVHEDCLRGPRGDAVEELTALGLPPSWGVMVATGHDPQRYNPVVLRNARKLQDVTAGLVEVYHRTFARSLAWKLARTEHDLKAERMTVYGLRQEVRALEERLEGLTMEGQESSEKVEHAARKVDEGVSRE